MVRIGAFRKTSLVDWDGHVVSTIFVIGCNFRCPFCFNAPLVFAKEASYTEDDILALLRSRKRWISDVCITGGEPTLYSDLPEFIQRIREENFRIKLDTNGTNPSMLQKLIDARLIDYIAMDVKAPPQKYNDLAGVRVNISNIMKSIEVIMTGEIPYEFRTTLVPTLLTADDIEEIARDMIPGAQLYAIQQFIPTDSLLEKGRVWKATSYELLKNAQTRAIKYVKHCIIRKV